MINLSKSLIKHLKIADNKILKLKNKLKSLKDLNK